jgi:pyridine nucleotide-disulfide oxidoreductase
VPRVGSTHDHADQSVGTAHGAAPSRQHPRDDPASERILGASVVGAEAGELIHVFAALMQAGATARAIVDMEAVHPSFAEGARRW